MGGISDELGFPLLGLLLSCGSHLSPGAILPDMGLLSFVIVAESQVQGRCWPEALIGVAFLLCCLVGIGGLCVEQLG